MKVIKGKIEEIFRHKRVKKENKYRTARRKERHYEANDGEY